MTTAGAPAPLLVAIAQRDVIALLHAYLIEHNLVASARSLELESGCAPRSDEGEDLAFARELVLDARWAEVEDLLAPLSAARGFDHAGVLFQVRRQRFLELLAGRQRIDTTAVTPSSGGADDALGATLGSTAAGAASVAAVVAALRSVEAVCESKTAFNSLCYCLTLPSVNEHPEFADWTPHLGRHRAYLAVRRELLQVFPPGALKASSSGGGVAPPPEGQLYHLLTQAAAAQAASRLASDPRMLLQVLTFDPLKGAAFGVTLNSPGSAIPSEQQGQGMRPSGRGRAPPFSGASGGNSGTGTSILSSLGGSSGTNLCDAVMRLAGALPRVASLPYVVPVVPFSKQVVVNGNGNGVSAGDDPLSVTVNDLPRSPLATAGRGAGGRQQHAEWMQQLQQQNPPGAGAAAQPRRPATAAPTVRVSAPPLTTIGGGSVVEDEQSHDGGSNALEATLDARLQRSIRALSGGGSDAMANANGSSSSGVATNSGGTRVSLSPEEVAAVRGILRRSVTMASPPRPFPQLRGLGDMPMTAAVSSLSSSMASPPSPPPSMGFGHHSARRASMRSSGVSAATTSASTSFNSSFAGGRSGGVINSAPSSPPRPRSSPEMQRRRRSLPDDRRGGSGGGVERDLPMPPPLLRPVAWSIPADDGGDVGGRKVLVGGGGMSLAEIAAARRAAMKAHVGGGESGPAPPPQQPQQPQAQQLPPVQQPRSLPSSRWDAVVPPMHARRVLSGEGISTGSGGGGSGVGGSAGGSPLAPSSEEFVGGDTAASLHRRERGDPARGGGYRGAVPPPLPSVPSPPRSLAALSPSSILRRRGVTEFGGGAVRGGASRSLSPPRSSPQRPVTGGMLGAERASYAAAAAAAAVGDDIARAASRPFSSGSSCGGSNNTSINHDMNSNNSSALYPPRSLNFSTHAATQSHVGGVGVGVPVRSIVTIESYPAQPPQAPSSATSAMPSSSSVSASSPPRSGGSRRSPTGGFNASSSSSSSSPAHWPSHQVFDHVSGSSHKTRVNTPVATFAPVVSPTRPASAASFAPSASIQQQSMLQVHHLQQSHVPSRPISPSHNVSASSSNNSSFMRRVALGGSVSASSSGDWLSLIAATSGGSMAAVGGGYIASPSAARDFALPQLAPIATYRDTQPIRAVSFDPSANGGRSGSASLSAALARSLIAVGTNSRALKLCRTPAQAVAAVAGKGSAGDAWGEAPPPSGDIDGESGLPIFSNERTWAGLHLGSLYALAWAYGSGDPACAEPLIATASNDTVVRVLRVAKNGGRVGGSGPLLSGSTCPLVVINTGCGTVRDVCFLGGAGSLAGGVGPYVAACGGGDFCVRVWDVAAYAQAPYQTLASAAVAATPSSGGGQSTFICAGASAPLASLTGHAGVVHAVRPWSLDGRHLLSASADGCVALWDLRAPSSRAALSLSLTLATGPGGQLAPVGASLPSGAVHGAVELHALSVRQDAALAGHAAGSGPREVAVGAGDGSVAILDLAAGKLVASARLHAGAVRSVDTHGPLVASAGDDGAIAIVAATLTGEGEGVWSRYAHHGGAVAPLAASYGGAASLASSATGAGLAVLALRRHHRDKALCVRWHPNAPALLSSSADRTALLWSAL